MKIKSEELIEKLEADVRQLVLSANYLEKEPNDTLVTQPMPGKWSIAQVIEHLNSYNRYYLPAIEKSLRNSNHPATTWFKAGWIGDYFTRLMLPKEDGTLKSKMKAPKNHAPAFIADSHATIKEFLGQQSKLLDLLDNARQKDIGHIRTPISISRLIKLKTGDTFRFLVAHQQRHFVQIANILKTVSGNR